YYGVRLVVSVKFLRFSKQSYELDVLALRLHRIAIDRVLDLHRSVDVEVSEAAAEIRRASDLPEEPRETLSSRSALRRQECAELLREIQQNGAGLEHTDRHRAAPIHERGNLRIR